MVKVKKNEKWKAVNLGVYENASDLISIEELTDYTAIRGKETYVEKTNDEKNRKKKNKKSQKRKKTEKNSLVPVKKPKISNENNDIVCDYENISLDNLSAWDNFSLPQPILKALAAKKFFNPTEIQSLTLPEAIFKKKNILGAAETGSGKTLAFGIPIITSIIQEQEKCPENKGRLWALIVTPTRELTIQVKNHISDLCIFTSIKVLEIVGGLSIEKQNRKLCEKPEIVVGTPGRLWELIRLENEHLKQVDTVKFFVIDEADRMLERDHFVEFNSLLERMNISINNKSVKRQTLVFSATLTLTHEPPSYVLNRKKKGKIKNNDSTKMTVTDKLQSFVNSLGLKSPAIIDITKKHVLASGISEFSIQCPIEEKDHYLYYLIKIHAGRKIVFCNSINCVRRLHRLLNVLECNAKILFADIAQNQRLKNLENFQKDPNGLLLATDVAARGLDIPSVEYIIHYEVPKACEIYVHRSGRSVRGISAHGTSILLVSPAESFHYDKIGKNLKKTEKIPAFEITRPEIFINSKQQVNLARKIEQMESKMRSVQSNASWIEKCAKEMDILLDDDEVPDKFDAITKKSYQKNIKQLKGELKCLISKPIIPRQVSMRYPNFEAVSTFLKIENKR